VDQNISKRTPYEVVTVYLIGAATILADQFAKFAVVMLLTLGQSRPLVDGLLSLTYVRNTGAAFSLFWGHAFMLGLLAATVGLALIVYQWRVRRTEPAIVAALGLLLGGALGNGIDRLSLGYVRDMFDLQWQGHNVFPVFNVADMAVCSAAALIAVYSVLQARARPVAERV